MVSELKWEIPVIKISHKRKKNGKPLKWILSYKHIDDGGNLAELARREV